MSEKKRVTYLIGAGASANALPVVNNLNTKLRLFIEELKILINLFNKNPTPEYRGFSVNTLDFVEGLIIEIANYQTIDTFAKKQYLKNDIPKYEAVKNLLSCFLIYEQLKKDNLLSQQVLGLMKNKFDENWSDHLLGSFRYRGFSEKAIEDLRNIWNKPKLQIDTRYESLYAGLLEKKESMPLMPHHINFVSWNYDMQFELAYKDYCPTSIDYIQQTLNIYPSANSEFNSNNSGIIKLNGTGNFSTRQGNLTNNKYDFTKLKYDTHTLHFLISQLSSSRIANNEINQLSFAWENNDQAVEVRHTAQRIISESDVIVIIGYSFPTFNREIDRFIFREFDDVYKIYDYESGHENRKKLKSIYVQDMPEVAAKIRERLKAVGNNLFDVSDVYDDVDQFFIPYELYL